MLETASIIPFICINLVFASIALAVGFLAGAWFLGGRKSGSSDTSTEDVETTRAIERTAMASVRIRDLAESMSSDVGEHSLQIEKVTDTLRELDLEDLEATGEGIVTALSEIIQANDCLQRRLEIAEEQIRSQAAEIRDFELEARTDSLTGLANRRAFDDEMRRRYSEWERKSTGFSLMIVDVDHFKKFNDSHGHQAGDQILREVGKTLAITCRDMDLPCRYGGEEFSVVMPATLITDAKIGAERVRKAVEELVVNFEGKPLSVTCSVGLAQISSADDIGRLLKRADEALYRSKEAGRNNSHVHEGSHCTPITPGIAASEAPSEVPDVEDHVVTQVLETLPNRTCFADVLRKRIAETSRTDQPISVMVLRVGGHASIKQEFGGAIGALTLDSVAQFLENTMREMDFVARIAEDTFAIMLPGDNATDASSVAERTSKALNNCAVPMGDGALDLGIELGVAELQGADTVETLVGRAEAMLDEKETIAIAQA